MRKTIWIPALLLFLILVSGCRTVVVEEEIVAPTLTIEVVVLATSNVPTKTPTAVSTKISTSTPTVVPSILPTALPTATSVKTATTKPTQTIKPTVTVVPVKIVYEVEVRISGLPEKESGCLKVVFYNAKKVPVYPTAKNGNYYQFEQEPFFLELLGSFDGKCPWESYWLRGDRNFKAIGVDINTGKEVVIYQFGKK